MQAHGHGLLFFEVWKVHMKVRDCNLWLRQFDDVLVRWVKTYSLTMILLWYGAKSYKPRILSALFLSNVWMILYFRQHLIVRLQMTLWISVLQRLLRLQASDCVVRVLAVQFASTLELLLLLWTTSKGSEIRAAACHGVLSSEVDVNLGQATSSAVLAFII